MCSNSSGVAILSETVKVTADGAEMPARAFYDAASRALRLELSPVSTGKEVCVSLGRDGRSPWKRRAA